MKKRITERVLPDLFDLKQWYTFVSLGFLVVPYATGALTFYYTEGSVPFAPRTFLFTAMVVLAGTLFYSRPRLSGAILCLLALLGLRLADALFLARIPTSADLDPRSFAAGPFAYAVALTAVLGDVRKRFSLVAGMIAALTLTICALINGWEWNYPGYFSTVEGRSAGWLQNPNDSSMAIDCMLGVVLALRPPRWLAVTFISLAGVGVYFTLSRGGAVVWVAMVLVFIGINLTRSARAFFYISALGVGALLIILRVADFASVLSTDKNVSSRQEFLAGRGSVDLNDTSRLDLLMEGVKGVMERPIIGYGTFSSYDYPFRPHNELVAVWLDNGIVGFVLLAGTLTFVVTSAVRYRRDLLIGCVPLLLLVPFSHNLLENRSYLFLFMTLAGQLGARNSPSPQPVQLRKRVAPPIRTQAEALAGVA